LTRAQHLDALIAAWRARTFAYGTDDCCQFIADAVFRFTGVDHRASFPTYANMEEAEALIDLHGGLTELIASAFGPPIHPSRAMPGNPVVYMNERGAEVAGICLGAKVVTPSHTGLLATSMSSAIAAWAM
jgi:hypothetical protein